jgi:hypothetical protein
MATDTKKTEAAEIERLWKAGAQAEATSRALALYHAFPTNEFVADYYSDFCFFRLRQAENAIATARDSYQRLHSANLFHTYCHFLVRKGKDDELLSLTPGYFNDPVLSGTAYLQYAAATLRQTGDFDLAVGLFHRGAQLPVMERHKSPAASLMPLRTFQFYMGMSDDESRAGITFLSERPNNARFVMCASGDEKYFREFFTIYRDSFFSFDHNPEHVLHFHLLDPTDELLSEISVPAADNYCRVYFSVERTSGTNRSYYYAARFVQLGRLLRHYECPIAVSDIDCVFETSVDDLIRTMHGQDVGITEIKSYPYPWQNFRAGLVAFNPSIVALEYARAIQNFLIRIPVELTNYWYVDQSALAQCVYLQRDSRRGNFVDLKAVSRSLCHQLSGGSGRPVSKASRARDFLKNRKPAKISETL